MKQFLKSLNIHYHNLDIYERAMTHASYAYENQTKKNERLEFLGDAVLGILMTHYLYQHMDASEGEMSKRKAKAVSSEALVLYASHIDLKSHMLLGKGESVKGPNDAMIADAFEAFLGAHYLDQGFKKTEKLFYQIVVPHLNETLQLKDYKSMLQELIHTGEKRNISYQVTKETGPSHHKHFVVVVKLDKQIILGQGEGSTKKEAEQNAAKDAMNKGNYDSKKII